MLSKPSSAWCVCSFFTSAAAKRMSEDLDNINIFLVDFNEARNDAVGAQKRNGHLFAFLGTFLASNVVVEAY